MKRRSFLELLAGFPVALAFKGEETAAGLALPYEPERIYSFAKARPLSSLVLTLNGNVIRRWEPGALCDGFSVAGSSGSLPAREFDRVTLERISKSGARSVLFSNVMHSRSVLSWQGEPIVAA
jgi:hypothetical protein